MVIKKNYSFLWELTGPKNLFMRPDGDFCSDTELKLRMYNNIKNEYDIKFVLDDRSSVVNMWRKIGVPCFQVDEGNF